MSEDEEEVQLLVGNLHPRRAAIRRGLSRVALALGIGAFLVVSFKFSQGFVGRLADTWIDDKDRGNEAYVASVFATPPPTAKPKAEGWEEHEVGETSTPSPTEVVPSDDQTPVASAATRPSIELPEFEPYADGPRDFERSESTDDFIELKKGEIVLELKNGHHFTGRIKALRADSVTLAYERGEYTFRFDELRGLTPEGDPEMRELVELPLAHVLLENGSRFTGRVLRSSADRVTLRYPTGQLTFLAADVREIDWVEFEDRPEPVVWQPGGPVEEKPLDESEWLDRAKRQVQVVKEEGRPLVEEPEAPWEEEKPEEKGADSKRKVRVVVPDSWKPGQESSKDS